MATRNEGKRVTEPPPPKMLDLSRFESVEDALVKIAPGDRYLNVGRRLMVPGARSIDGLPMAHETVFWLSMVSRSEGLHGAIVREIAHENPHAVLPLIRAFAEAVVLVIYVTDHPSYIQAVAANPRELPKGAPRRKTMKALIDYVFGQASQMKAVYAQLSEATHFGSIAMWTAHVPESREDDSFHVSWTNAPRWRSDEQALIACGLTLELAEVMERYLGRFADCHIRPRLAQG